MKRLITYISFAGALMLASCSKDVNLNLPTPPNHIVVEGHIEPNNTAYVYLSHNFAFFGTTTISSILSNDVIHGALITVSDGTTTDTMKETIPTLGFYEGSKLKGQIGKTYNLKVVTNGNTLTSSTTILQPIPLDSAWFKVQTNLDTLGFMWAILKDPPVAGNCYRWFAKRLGKDTTYIPPDGSAFNDQFINGKSFEFFYSRGHLPGSKAADDTNKEAGYFKTGETVVIKFCTIDYTAYNFFSNYYFQTNNNGNPFGSPAPIPTNINGGIGIWCAYGSSYDTVICK